jgi:predicted CoA-binding protein
MPQRAVIDEFLAQRTLAFVGVSRDPKQFANTVYRGLRDSGHTMLPVNTEAGGAPIEGDASFASLRDLPEAVDGVVVMVPKERAAEVVDEAIERGIPRVWLHRGIGSSCVSDAAVEHCRAAGVEVVDGACPFMFMEPVQGFHRVHRAFARRRFA